MGYRGEGLNDTTAHRGPDSACAVMDLDSSGESM